jgi:glycerophosphoryl diester phosphodiesterase
MQAIIELKGKNNTEHYDEIIDTIAKYDVDVTFISFHEENLYELRKLSDAPMFYLAQVMDDESIEIAKSIGNCGIDFNGYKDKNYDNDSAIIKKAQAEGLTLGAWTIDDLETMQKLLDLGVDYITTDCITY